MIYSPGQDRFYAVEFKPTYEMNGLWPLDGVEVSEAEFNEFCNSSHENKQRAFVNNKLCWIPIERTPSIDVLVLLEKQWRDSELIRSDYELNKVQDSDPKSVGSVTEWRAYRKALRALPEHPDFPNASARPIAPDSV